MNIPECKKCDWWISMANVGPNPSEFVGSCRRYPKPRKKDAYGGCGEHSAGHQRNEWRARPAAQNTEGRV